MLEDQFGLPTFINNDGDLFAYGEATAGFLPYVNGLLEKAGSPKRYRNLLGVTLGTGFGGGIVRDGALFIGDNSVAGEIWLARHKLEHDTNAEEGASIRAVRRVYAAEAGLPLEDAPEPKAIYEIAEGRADGDRAAAHEAFRRMGEVAGDAIAQAVTLLDGLVVIGGGIAGAHRQFLPAIVDEMNGNYRAPDGKRFPRLAQRAFNLEDPAQLRSFPQRGNQGTDCSRRHAHSEIRWITAHGHRNLAPGDQRGDGHWRVCIRIEELGRKSIMIHRILLLVFMAWSAIEAQPYTLGVGVYPGDPSENFGPTFRVDRTYRNLTLDRPVYQSSSYDYNLTASVDHRRHQGHQAAALGGSLD